MLALKMCEHVYSCRAYSEGNRVKITQSVQFAKFKQG